MSVRTEGDEIEDNTGGIVVFGKNAKGQAESILIDPTLNLKIVEGLAEIVTELKIIKTHLSRITDETLTEKDI